MANFRSIHTPAGLRKLNASRLGGDKVAIAEIAFGDGAGNPVDFGDGDVIGLVRERFRTAINRVYQDPENPLLYYAEGIIPATAGGFVIREMSLIDTDNEVIAVANTPDNYQPTAEEGAIGDGVYRMAFMASNAGNVKLVIDPNSAVASRAWVINTMTFAKTLPPGGAAGEILTKSSTADGDADWDSPDNVSVNVNSVEEQQTLSAQQTIVDLAYTSTIGLAIYIDGKRITRGAGSAGWQPHETVSTRVILGQSYDPGTKLLAAQNEPAGNIGNPLERSANLADIPDKSEARKNLDILSRGEARQMAPAGMIGMFAGSSAPTGWLKANGAQVAKDAYPSLYAAVGDVYTPAGQSPSVGSFFLPDLRGLFPRFWDDGRGNDTGRSLGSTQGDQLAAHAHSGRTADAGDHAHDSSFGEGNKHIAAAPYGMSEHRPGGRNAGSSGGIDYDNFAWQTSTDGRHAHDFTTGVSGGNETRPKNVALLACIKY